MMKNLSALLDYGYKNNLITKYDESYVVNKILALIGADSFEKCEYAPFDNIEAILEGLIDFAYQNGKIEDNTITYRDILSAQIMDNLTPRPTELINKFNEKYNENPKLATDFFYDLSQKNNYIMTERIKKDIRWKTNTKYGILDITINLSKPEKDPKDIANAKNQKQTGYPKCLLCVENVGIKGNLTQPARTNHRIIPIELANEEWFFQYSPYVYYNEHSIVLNCEHTPMKINKQTFLKLLYFVEKFPHYFVGSNADLPIVGGSILTHDHFQGGNYEFPMAVAKIKQQFTFLKYPSIKVGIVNWALSTIRLISDNISEICELANEILEKWRNYSDIDNEILAYTNDTPHNTITPIARKRNGQFELDLILRNNRTTDEHPMGIFHPHSQYHHIKKENIGLIEAMGLAVLPARLKDELGVLDDKKKQDIGEIFLKILENCAVFKETDIGNKGFFKFMEKVNSNT